MSQETSCKMHNISIKQFSVDWLAVQGFNPMPGPPLGNIPLARPWWNIVTTGWLRRKLKSKKMLKEKDGTDKQVKATAPARVSHSNRLKCTCSFPYLYQIDVSTAQDVNIARTMQSLLDKKKAA